MFTGHKYITDKSESTGFEQYLLIDSDNGFNVEVYGIDADTPMDLETLLNEVYREHGFTVSIERAMGGANYASIITDSQTPDSVVVWTSCDFYLDSEN